MKTLSIIKLGQSYYVIIGEASIPCLRMSIG